jgi:hypothetical protein
MKEKKQIKLVKRGKRLPFQVKTHVKTGAFKNVSGLDPDIGVCR